MRCAAGEARDAGAPRRAHASCRGWHSAPGLGGLPYILRGLSRGKGADGATSSAPVVGELAAERISVVGAGNPGLNPEAERITSLRDGDRRFGIGAGVTGARFRLLVASGTRRPGLSLGETSSSERRIGSGVLGERAVFSDAPRTIADGLTVATHGKRRSGSRGGRIDGSTCGKEGPSGASCDGR